jgi:hypothetical protein
MIRAYLGRGVPMAVVQRILRHSDPRITSERYAHLEQDYLGAEMRKLSLVPKNTEQTNTRTLGENELLTDGICFPNGLLLLVTDTTHFTMKSPFSNCNDSGCSTTYTAFNGSLENDGGSLRIVFY